MNIEELTGGREAGKMAGMSRQVEVLLDRDEYYPFPIILEPSLARHAKATVKVSEAKAKRWAKVLDEFEKVVAEIHKTVREQTGKPL